MRRTLPSRLVLGLLTLVSLGVAACQTTDPTRRSLAARATTASCDHESLNSRRDCEDLPGCYWNNEVGHCAAQ